MVTNTKNVDEPYCRSTLGGGENLPELKRCGSRRRLSGHVRLMQRPELVKPRRPAAAAAECELSEKGSGARRKKEA